MQTEFRSPRPGCPAVTEEMTTDETVEGGVPVALEASASHHGKKKIHRTVRVGTKSVTIAAGKTVVLQLSLDAAGQKLLARFGKLPVKLSITIAGSSSGATTDADFPRQEEAPRLSAAGPPELSFTRRECPLAASRPLPLGIALAAKWKWGARDRRRSTDLLRNVSSTLCHPVAHCRS
jgi:hypothetical protein